MITFIKDKQTIKKFQLSFFISYPPSQNSGNHTDATGTREEQVHGRDLPQSHPPAENPRGKRTGKIIYDE